MAKGILGRKLGMTQIFDAAGNLIPVTIVDCSDNVVLQQKTVENDGYVAVRLLRRLRLRRNARKFRGGDGFRGRVEHYGFHVAQKRRIPRNLRADD